MMDRSSSDDITVEGSDNPAGELLVLDVYRLSRKVDLRRARTFRALSIIKQDCYYRRQSYEGEHMFSLLLLLFLNLISSSFSAPPRVSVVILKSAPVHLSGKAQVRDGRSGFS